MREAARNVMAYCMIGLESKPFNLFNEERPRQMLPLSHRLLRMQRAVLYQGVKTKNTHGSVVQDRKDFLERSYACADIVSTLQKLKANPRYFTQTRCKVILKELDDELQKWGDRYVAKTGVINDLQLTTE